MSSSNNSKPIPTPVQPNTNPFIRTPSTSSDPNGKAVEKAPPEYTESDAEALFGIPPPPPTHGTARLSLPVAIPQTTNKYDAAFARAYDDHLRHSGIEMADWLRFTDGLNLAIVSHNVCYGLGIKILKNIMTRAQVPPFASSISRVWSLDSCTFLHCLLPQPK